MTSTVNGTTVGTRSGDQVLSSLEAGVLRVQINRPDSLNSVTADVLDDMADAVEAATTQADVHVVVLSGAGRAFCSGADISGSDELSGAKGSAATLDGASRLVTAIRDVRRPVVSVVQGPCAGVGVPIALSADLVLASSKAFFMLAFTKIGLMPDGGATALVAASAGRAKAMRMALLAERLTATEAESLGLVSHLFEVDTFEDDVDAVLDVLRAGPMVGFARTKHAINTATLDALDGAFALEHEGQLGLLAAPDFVEGTAAFNEKRAPSFTDVV